MSVIRRNILANLAGQGWTTLIGLVTVPFYIKFLGIEGYGLIGFYLILQEVFNSFLDFGLSITINREVARYSASPDKVNQTRDLVRTLEVGYWLIGLFLGMGVIFASSLIATHWLKADNISSAYIQQVVIAMGVTTILQWPLTFYQGGLLGLQKMVLLNGINVGFSTLRSLGTILMLWLIAPTAMTFFQWQIIAIALQVFVMAFLLWRSLPPSDHVPRFDSSLILSIWRFAVGMGATSLVTFFLTQSDRLILSKILTLEFFGYYTLAGTLNNGVLMISSQIIRALFPRFSAMIGANDTSGIKSLYHKGSQLISVAILPTVAVAALYSTDLIQLWTHDTNVAMHTAPIVALLFIGSAFNSLMFVPYNLAVAYGWTSLGFIQNVISTILFVPLMIGMALWLGGVGAALTWVFISSGVLMVTPWIIRRRILQDELPRWYLMDIGLPLIVTIVVAVFLHWFISVTLPAIPPIFAILLVAFFTLIGACLSASEIRRMIFSRVQNLKWN